MFLFLATAALAAAPVPEGLGDWSILSDDEIWVGCTKVGGQDWCRATSELDVSIDQLSALLHDIPRYPQIFDRVSQAAELESGLVHVVLNMPFPLADRDYVARFTEHHSDGEKVFRWVADDAAAPPADKVVRLVNSAGQWRLVDEGGATRVEYTWNGDLGGDVPSWALERAWRLQGTEVMEWLADAAAGRPARATRQAAGI